MSGPTTTVRIKGTVEDADTKSHIDLDLEVPLRPLATLVMGLIRSGSCTGSPTQGEVDTTVRRMMED